MKNLLLVFLLAFSTYFCKTKADSNIVNLDQLNDAIKNGPNRKVGFLSHANFQSVEAFLDKNVEAVIFGDSTMLEIAVIGEDVIAGLMSGIPGTGPAAFNTFPSEVISPRAFQMKPEDCHGSKDLLHAVDAAVVRTQIDGELLQAERDNPPFQAQYVQNCYTGDSEKLPFPPANEATGLLKDILDQRKIKILAYGTPDDKPNWNEDGNYQVDPPTGFWPDYVKYFLGQFQKAYGEDITLERVWMKSEDGTNMLLNGTIHMTEPYFIYEAIEFETPQKWFLDFSCIVMGYEQTYFTLKY